MNIGAIVSRARKAAADNTPTILTAIGVTGTIATVVLASKASFKAAEILAERREDDKRLINQGQVPIEEIDELSSKKVEIGLVWKCYIPAAATGVITVACIVGANQVSTRRAAALASAYSVSQEAFREYKDKVFEKLGEKKEQAIRDEIAQDRVNETPQGTFMMFSESSVICQDLYSGRYFDCDMETIRKAVNDINWALLNEGEASLTDFWDLIGLSKTSDSDEIGWLVDTNKKFEVRFSSALSPNNRPVMTIEFDTTPIRSYYKNR